MRLRWTPEAAEDLTRIFEFIQHDRPTAAADVTRRVYRHIALLRTSPLMGRSGRIEHTRELAVPGTPFIAIYEVAPDVVKVLRIVHGAMRWP